MTPMRFTSLAAAVILAFTPSQSLVGQSFPVVCSAYQARDKNDYRLPQEFVRDTIWSSRLLERVRLLAKDLDGILPNISSGALDDYWQRDSTIVEASLARLVIDEYFTNRLEASIAAELYSQYSGRPGPMLLFLGRARSNARYMEGLNAINSDKLTPWESYTIARIACNAAWLLMKAHTDSEYFNVPFAYSMLQPVEEVLLSAFRALDNNGRVEIEPLILAAIPDNGAGRIEWIKDEDRK